MSIIWQLKCINCGIWLTDSNGDLYISDHGMTAQCKNATMCNQTKAANDERQR